MTALKYGRQLREQFGRVIVPSPTSEPRDMVPMTDSGNRYEPVTSEPRDMVPVTEGGNRYDKRLIIVAGDM
jgi:hypothetical protein